MKKFSRIILLLLTAGLILGLVGCPTPTSPSVPQYTVTYVTAHGTAPASKTVARGYTLTAADLPTLAEESWSFGGWTSNGTAVSAGTKVNADMTLTAVWTEVIPDYAVSYSSSHGTAPASKTVARGYTLTAADLPTLADEPGWRFAGWDKSVGYVVTHDTTITASWVETCVISYNCDQNCIPVPSKTVDKGYVLTAEDFPNCAELGYYTQWETGSVGTIVNSDITLRAIGIVCPRISYSTAHGTAPETQYITPGYTLTAADLPTLANVTGWRFNGWDKSVGYVVNSNTTITASWVETCVISYDCDEHCFPVPSKTVDKGYVLTAEDLPNCAKVGYYAQWENGSVGTVVNSDITLRAKGILQGE